MGWQAISALPCSAHKHINTSFPINNNTPYQYATRSIWITTHAWLSENLRSMIMNSQYTRDCLSTGPTKGAHGTPQTLLAQSAGGNPGTHKVRKKWGKTGEGRKEKRGKVEVKEGEMDKIPFWHFFFPLPALALMVYRMYSLVIWSRSSAASMAVLWWWE